MKKAFVLIALVGVLAVSAAILWGRCSSTSEEAGKGGGEMSANAKIADVRNLTSDRPAATSRSLSSGAKVEKAARDRPQREVNSPAEISGYVAEAIALLAEADEQTERDLLRDLRRLRRPTLLRALRGLARDGTVREREQALYAVSLCFGAAAVRDRTSPIRGDGGGYGGERLDSDAEDLGVVSDGVREDADPEARAAMLSHDLIDCIGQGLEDEDAHVRNAAYEASRSMDEPESAVLSERVLQGTDPNLKRMLLAEVSPLKSERDVLTLIAAVENADAGIAKTAADRLSQVAGERIGDEAAALDWWERSGAEFLNTQHEQSNGEETNEQSIDNG